MGEFDQVRKHSTGPDGQQMLKVTRCGGRLSCLALDLSPPPAHADKQKTPIVKEFRRFALEPVADELQRPSHQEQRKPINPQPVNKEASEEQGERNQDGWYPQGMADPVDRVLMAAGILRDPLLVRTAAEHSDLMIHGSDRKVAAQSRVERPGAGVLASLVLGRLLDVGL